MDTTRPASFNDGVKTARHDDDRSPMWLRRARRKALGLLLALGIMAWGAITIAALPVWPVVGVAVAALAVGVNSITSRMREPVCFACGNELGSQVGGVYGVICSSCGAINTQDGQAADDLA